jgi:hypothetical protein
MNPPVVATYKIQVEGNEQINCSNGGGGRFHEGTTLSWSGHNDPFTLAFFVWDGTKTTTPDWPFTTPSPTGDNKATTPFQGVLKPTTQGEGVYGYSISKAGYKTLDPIIIVDK